MAHYIDADRLRKEIEFAKKVYEHPNRVVHGVSDGFRQDGRAAMCDDILKKIDSLQEEQPEVDLDATVNEAFDKYSSVDGYGQLVVSFNRAELYSFIKKIARKEENK